MERVRVLLVDDSADFLASTAQYLANNRRVTVVGCARDGAEGVALARSLAPDVVVMDVSMPVMSGFTAAALIKQERPGITVLLTSLYDEPEYHLGATTAGADRFVGKSQLPAALSSLVETLTTA